MKAIKQTLAYSILVIAILTSCKKYEDGPAFSLRSKEERVSNLWKIGYAFNWKDSVNVTTDYTGETWEFIRKGDFIKRENGVVENTGTWEFTNNKEKISVKFPLTTTSYDILKLKEKELWLKDAEEELHLIPAN